uniref:uncharacterized transmembrane protein DDB_G0289901-like n=1 Tax=Styela clava TaxID=7725 RepID=UPI00193A25C4|nr:uncharacterized transmembrane protein DDB_G0289901-like [Styela clava]
MDKGLGIDGEIVGQQVKKKIEELKKQQEAKKAAQQKAPTPVKKPAVTSTTTNVKEEPPVDPATLNNPIKCDICDESLENLKGASDHFNGKVHRRRMELHFMERYVKTDKCSLCGTNLTSLSQIYDHYNGYEHASKLVASKPNRAPNANVGSPAGRGRGNSLGGGANSSRGGANNQQRGGRGGQMGLSRGGLSSLGRGKGGPGTRGRGGSVTPSSAPTSSWGSNDTQPTINPNLRNRGGSAPVVTRGRGSTRGNLGPRGGIGRGQTTTPSSGGGNWGSYDNEEDEPQNNSFNQSQPTRGRGAGFRGGIRGVGQRGARVATRGAQNNNFSSGFGNNNNNENQTSSYGQNQGGGKMQVGFNKGFERPKPYGDNVGSNNRGRGGNFTGARGARGGQRGGATTMSGGGSTWGNNTANKELNNNNMIWCSVCKISINSSGASAHYASLQHKTKSGTSFSGTSNIQKVGNVTQQNWGLNKNGSFGGQNKPQNFNQSGGYGSNIKSSIGFGNQNANQSFGNQSGTSQSYGNKNTSTGYGGNQFNSGNKGFNTNLTSFKNQSNTGFGGGNIGKNFGARPRFGNQGANTGGFNASNFGAPPQEYPPPSGPPPPRFLGSNWGPGRGQPMQAGPRF